MTFLFNEEKFVLECKLNYRMGLGPSRIVLIWMKVKMVEWEVTLNMSKLAPKFMIDCSRRVAWSMTVSKKEPKDKMSL